MNTMSRVQILVEAAYFSDRSNTINNRPIKPFNRTEKDILIMLDLLFGFAYLELCPSWI